MRKNWGKPVIAASILAVTAGVSTVIYFASHRRTVPPSLPVQYNPNVRVIDDKPLAINNRQIVFSGTDHDFSAGNVLLNDRYGFGGKVTSVRVVNGKTICNTTPPSLIDKFKNLPDAPFRPEFDSKTITTPYKSKVPGLSFKWVEDPKTHVDPFEIDFDNMRDGPISITGHATLDPHPYLNPGNIVNGSRESFEAAYDCELKGVISVKAVATGTNFNLPAQVVYNYPIGVPVTCPLPGLAGTFWAVPRLEVVESGVSGDIVSNWERTETFDLKTHAGMRYDQTNGWSTETPLPTCSLHDDTAGNIKGSFYVDVVPVKIRLIYAIYAFDPTQAFAANPNMDFDIGPYIALESHILLHGSGGPTGKENYFRVRGRLKGTLGFEWGAFDSLMSALGVDRILEPVTIFDLRPQIYPASPDTGSPGLNNGSSGLPSQTHKYRRHSHGRYIRRHYRRSYNSHLNTNISKQIRDGARVLKKYQDVLGLTRDEKLNHVTIDNSVHDIVSKGIESLTDQKGPLSDEQKKRAARHFEELARNGKSLLAVRNRIADGALRRASHGKKVGVLRHVHHNAKELRDHNSALNQLKGISSEKEQSSVQPEQAVNPSPPPAQN